MAKVFIDVGAFGESWLQDKLQELIDCEMVVFSYAATRKFRQEHEKCLKAQQFYKLMGEIGKREDANPADVQKNSNYLESLREWKAEKDCDDPHIFALVSVKPTKYIFTTDSDIANCRTCINRIVDRRFCNFRLICSETNYKAHKPKIVS